MLFIFTLLSCVLKINFHYLWDSRVKKKKEEKKPPQDFNLNFIGKCEAWKEIFALSR